MRRHVVVYEQDLGLGWARTCPRDASDVDETPIVSARAAPTWAIPKRGLYGQRADYRQIGRSRRGGVRDLYGWHVLGRPREKELGRSGPETGALTSPRAQ